MCTRITLARLIQKIVWVKGSLQVTYKGLQRRERAKGLSAEVAEREDFEIS